jgi:hypothetical protein
LGLLYEWVRLCNTGCFVSAAKRPKVPKSLGGYQNIAEAIYNLVTQAVWQQ